MKTSLSIQDVHTLNVVYVDDMSAIQHVSDGIMLMQNGRWLTQEDADNNANVCVINKTFADVMG